MNLERPFVPRGGARSPHAPQLPRNAGSMRRAAWASVFVATALIAAKSGAYFYTGSVAVLASLADSAVDLVASLTNLVAIGQALAPADHQHRFGHGKAEPLAGLAQAAFIIASATFLITESIGKLIVPVSLNNGVVGIGAILFSMAATLGLVLYQRKVAYLTRSPAIAADSVHYAGDLLTNIGVIAAIVLSAGFGWLIADPLIGLAIALVLCWSAWWVVRRSFDQLMDREFPEEDRRKIKEIVLTHERVMGLHDLRTRAAGTQRFIQVHIEMDPGLSLSQAHDASDAVERDLLAAFPGAEVLIHADPFGDESPPQLART